MATGRGGKRAGAGRPKGSRSAATKDEIAGISDMAKLHCPAMLKVLVSIAGDGEASPAARVAAANSIIDRGYGKPQQAIDHSSNDGSMSPITSFEIVTVDAATGSADKAAS